MILSWATSGRIIQPCWTRMAMANFDRATWSLFSTWRTRTVICQHRRHDNYSHLNFLHHHYPDCRRRLRRRRPPPHHHHQFDPAVYYLFNSSFIWDFSHFWGLFHLLSIHEVALLCRWWIYYPRRVQCCWAPRDIPNTTQSAFRLLRPHRRQRRQKVFSAEVSPHFATPGC